MIVGNCASPGSCIYLSWCSPLPGHWDSGHHPGAVLSSTAAGSACSEPQLTTSALCTRFFREEGNAQAALEPGCCRWQQNVLPRAQRQLLSPAWWILPSPPAVGEAAVAEAPGSFKNRGYLVINEVLKMRYKRLNVLSHLLGPYVLGKHLSVL